MDGEAAKKREERMEKEITQPESRFSRLLPRQKSDPSLSEDTGQMANFFLHQSAETAASSKICNNRREERANPKRDTAPLLLRPKKRESRAAVLQSILSLSQLRLAAKLLLPACALTASAASFSIAQYCSFSAKQQTLATTYIREMKPVDKAYVFEHRSGNVPLPLA